MEKSVKVKKFSGELVEFDQKKLINSLINAQADHDLAVRIAKEVTEGLYDGIPTKKIYQHAFKLLKGKKRSSAARYKLKRAIMELGPSGFPFEKFIGHILDNDGYEVQVGVMMEGNCVSHEVDVLAKKDQRCYIIECKYHNSQGKANDVKIPLYINSRFRDIKRKLQSLEQNQGIDYQGWIFTNTRFTLDAINYAKCAGLQLISWDYPENKSLKYRINNSKLYPITSLTSLTKREKSMLLDQGIVLCKEIYQQQEVLDPLRMSPTRIKKVMEDIEDLSLNGIS